MLIKDIVQVKYVVQVSAATDFEPLKQHINNAEAAYIAPLLGSDLYETLVEYHADDNNYFITGPDFPFDRPQDASHTEADHYTAILLWYVQHALMHLAYHKGFDMLNAYISDGGFKRKESDHVKSLFKYQEDNLKKYYHETGMNALDTVLEWIERKIGTFKTDFEEQYKQLKGRIIPDTKTFQQHYNINNSRLTFMRLNQHMKAAEELHLVHWLGRANLDYVLEELKKDEPATKVVSIMPYLRDPIAYFSVAMLMQESGADITERGLYFVGQRSISNSDYVMPAIEARIKELVRRNNNLAESYLTRLRYYLTSHAAEWNDYDNPRGRLHNRDNTDKKTFWV